MFVNARSRRFTRCRQARVRMRAHMYDARPCRSLWHVHARIGRVPVEQFLGVSVRVQRGLLRGSCTQPHDARVPRRVPARLLLRCSHGGAVRMSVAALAQCTHGHRPRMSVAARAAEICELAKRRSAAISCVCYRPARNTTDRRRSSLAWKLRQVHPPFECDPGGCRRLPAAAGGCRRLLTATGSC